MFKIEFTTDNAAFSDGMAPDEIARILRQHADRIEQAGCNFCDWPVRDVNGNRIGKLSYDLHGPDYEPSESAQGLIPIPDGYAEP